MYCCAHKTATLTSIQHTVQGRHGRFLADKAATVAAKSLVYRYCQCSILYCKIQQPLVGAVGALNLVSQFINRV